VRFPPPLRPGDVVAIFAGSSPFDPTLAWRGLGWLASRYRLRFDRSLFDRRGYLAGSDERRLNELAAYLAAPEIRALIAVRGGYGLSRIVHRIDGSSLRENPRWIVGFSDVTALHVEAVRLGVASVHGPMVAALGRADYWTRTHLISTLEAPLAPFRLPGLRMLHPGTAEGPLAGGNLTMLHACATAGRLALPPGCILLLEDVTERPYRLDRMVTTLLVGGHLARVSGVLLGDFTDCGPGPDGVTAEEVLRERLGVLGVPVLAGAPVGHGARNLPVVLGRRLRLDGVRGEAVSEAGR
jgi:muramoyltetrapeptide carboxypeptidase